MKMNIGDIVMVVNYESLPESFLGCFGVIINSDDYKVVVNFKGVVNDKGSLSHTAVASDLKKIGETNY
jgi:hypothetical protein